ncbi:dynein axonemal heavy chain 3-like [Homarus americanus]|uniref:dynein axonemal heavy chain 3-like n=1 Tax=Homarus americanus TaxID=6706 RepID=UPI001C455961|nr:dynein axonemal heavy chain 3-like [Homarus americanus]XP_042205176.1 dynein axonemal heavy chain 3-like [Homarus americanus]XP_042219366.1 dynein axonemal heavy chain 3-like [Homarus americanus]
MDNAPGHDPDLASNLEYQFDFVKVLFLPSNTNLYTNEEKAEILEKIQAVAKDEGKKMDSSPMTLFGYFNERVRANLHLVVAMSPIGDTFRTRLRMFPSLINCCTIDWFTAWPDDALEMVATSLLQETKLEASLLAHCVTVCKYFHHSIDDLAHRFYEQLRRRYYVTL